MSSVPTCKHQTDPQRHGVSLSARVCVRGLVEHRPDIANQLTGSSYDVPFTAFLLAQLLISDDVLLLPCTIAGELLRVYELCVRCHATDAPSTTWELPACGLRDLQPAAASFGSNS